MTLFSPSTTTLKTLFAGEEISNAFLFFTIITFVVAMAIITTLFLFLNKKRETTTAMGKGATTTDFRPFKLMNKEVISHDTRRFTFGFADATMKLGLPIGQHISFRFTDSEGKTHYRSYTPVTGDETLGSVSFVIKVYKAGVHPKFPSGGKMSQHVDSLAIGDTLDMKGPKGHMTYLGRGRFTIKVANKKPIVLQERVANHFGMIAGGTGITPMLQIIHAIFRDGLDSTTTIRLLYANQTEDDILVRDELEFLAQEYPDRFKVSYTLDRPPSSNWTGCTGFVSKEMIANTVLLEEDNDDDDDGKKRLTQILMCGPPPMLKYACIPALRGLGLKEDQWFCF